MSTPTKPTGTAIFQQPCWHTILILILPLATHHITSCTASRPSCLYISCIHSHNPTSHNLSHSLYLTFTTDFRQLSLLFVRELDSHTHTNFCTVRPISSSKTVLITRFHMVTCPYSSTCLTQTVQTLDRTMENCRHSITSHLHHHSSVSHYTTYATHHHSTSQQTPPLPDTSRLYTTSASTHTADCAEP